MIFKDKSCCFFIIENRNQRESKTKKRGDGRNEEREEKVKIADLFRSNIGFKKTCVGRKVTVRLRLSNF